MSHRLAPDSVRLRPAEGAERRACRMLLQNADRLGHLGELLIVTTTEEKPRVLAAMSLLSTRDSSGAGVLIASARVVRGERRRGVGSLLLETAIGEARLARAAAVVGQCDPAEEPDGAAFLEARGFARAEKLTTFEVPTDRLAAHIHPLRHRLRQTDRIPPGARLVALRNAPLAAVATLHAEHLAGTPRGVAESLNDLLVHDDAGHHGVLMLGGEVLGLMLARTIDGVSTVESEVLAPSCRAFGASTGWASVLLLAAEIDRALACGSRTTRFSCTSGNRPTRRLAQRAEAKPIREEIVYRLAVTR